MVQHRQVPDTTLPFVSCYCPTYARPHLLEQAIESFLKQDYAGKKELVILNDMPEQELVYDHPEIRIVNSPARIAPLGKKFNECVKLCRGEVLFVWDDDDICLPWRISYSIKKMQDGLFHTKQAFFEPDRNRLLKTGRNAYHANLAFEKQQFSSIGGYLEVDSRRLDIDMMQRLGVFEHSQEIEDKHIFYIYRWAGTGSYHVSQWGDESGGITPAVNKYVKKKIISGECRTGPVQLYPHWTRDWLALVDEAIKAPDESRKIISFDDEVLEAETSVHLNWDTLEIESIKQGGGHRIQCNLASALVFQSINGRRTNAEIEKRLDDAFPEQSISEDIRSVISEFKQLSIANVVSDSGSRLKIAILTQITPEISAYAQHSEAINGAYAKQAGYDFHVGRDWPFDDRVAHWSSVYMLRKYLSSYDYVLWLDADAIVTRFNMSLEHFIRLSPDANILACDDRPMGTSVINTGAVLVKNTPWTERFLEVWWELGNRPEYAFKFPSDQGAITELFQNKVMQAQDHIKVFPAKLFNSIYPAQETHTAEDFVLHLMATPDDVRKQVFSEWQLKLINGT